MVDDCSTDNSVQIVENYAQKFNGRLQIAQTEKNSGGGGYVPRNIGLNSARGEYVFFVDADDFVLLTALETLYMAARDNEADVVYNGSCYVVRQPNDIYLWRDNLGNQLIERGLEDNPTLITEDSDKLISQLLVTGLHHMPYTKFVKREFLLENKIIFPEIISGGDFVWTIQVFGFSKRCLRLPNAVYFYRSNPQSITLKREPLEEQILISSRAFVAGAEILLRLSDRFDSFKKDPSYLYYALKPFWNNFLRRTFVERERISSSEVYEILYREFDKHEFGKQSTLAGFMMPFLVSMLDEARKLDKEHLQIVDKLNKRLDLIKDSMVSSSSGASVVVPQNTLNCPAVSVVIPLYNAEKYVIECLDSLLAQTFQDFEVIVVDDCSTDNSVTLVEDYAHKFNGRLKLHRLKENSGSGGVPRNKGAILSQGEYIKFLDADDMLVNTALAELYALAKEYDADVVHCPRNYAIDNDGSGFRISPKISVEKPTLETQGFEKLMVKMATNKGYAATYCQFVRRSLMIENEIFFPQIYPSEDLVWTYNLIFYAKRFLYAPNAVYIIRTSENSMMRKERNPRDIIRFRLNAALFGITLLDKSLSRHKFLIDNPSCRYYLLEKFLNHEIDQSLKVTQEIADDEIYSTIKDGFGDRLGEYDTLVSALCTALYKAKRNDKMQSELINRFGRFINARIDLKLNSTTGDLQILEVSDDKAKVTSWKQKNGISYNLSSFVGTLTFVAKTTVDEKISLILRGMDVRDPKDKSKRIPYWIDYTKLIVNGKIIFSDLTPAWCEKPYKNIISAKANEEIIVQVDWQPHMSGILEPKFKSSPYRIQNPLPHKFKNFLTARVDVKFLPKASQGEFQIFSASDNKAEVLKPEWFQKDGVGYVITSLAGELTFVSKASVDGQICFNLRGMDVRKPEDWKKGNTKRIPYWIDYTTLVINGKKILSTLTPTWCDKPYSHTVEVKAGEEITVQVEWLPHRSDV